MPTLAELLPTAGIKCYVRGLSLGVQEREFEDKERGKTITTALVVMCGGKVGEVRIKVDTGEFDLNLFPPVGAFVSVPCERGSFNGRDFYNKPGRPTVLLNADGTSPEPQAAKATR